MQIAKTELWSLHKFLPSAVVITVNVDVEEPTYVHVQLSAMERRKYMERGNSYLDSLARRIIEKPEDFFDVRYEYSVT